MGGILEAKLLVAGEDRTKAMFAAIERRMDAIMAKARDIGRVTETADRALDGAGAALGRADRSLGLAAERLERAAVSMERAAAATARSSRVAAVEGSGRGMIVVPNRSGRHGGHHGRGAYLAANIESRHGARHMIAEGGFGAGGMVGAVGAVVAAEGGIHVIESGAVRQHERVREDISGMPAAEREEAEKRAAYLSAKYASISQTEVMHTLRNMRAITGSYREASELADDMLRTRLVAQTARPGQDVEHDFDQLMKGLELYGVTQDPKAFHDAMRRVQRVMAIEGDTLTADSIYQSFKYTRQALPGTSQRFMLGTAPALYQEMGGNSFGNALSSFNQAVVQGRMGGRSLKLALDLGLIDKGDVNFADGTPKSVKTALEGGHGFKDWRLAKSDPDLWIWNRLEKALADHKVVDPATITQIASTLFGNRMAADLIGKIITQRARIEKNQDNLARAPEDPAARIIDNDPINAWQGAKAGFDNLGAAIMTSGRGLTTALNSVSTWANDEAGRLQGVRTPHQIRVENGEKYGLDSDRDFSNGPVDDLVEAKRKALADDAAKVMAKRLELKGITDEIAARNTERAAGGFWGRLGFGGRPTADLTTRALAIRTELKDLETATARLRDLSDAYDRLQRARADQPSAHLINRRDGPAVPGFSHAAFPLGSDFSHVDPSTGRGWGVPAPPSIAPSPGYGSDSQDHIVRALAASPYGSLGPKPGPSGPIEAELKGSADVSVKVAVEPSSNLLTIVKKAETAAASGNLRMNLGSGAPGTGPAGRTPSGR